jgi:tripartite-type tricarboxylate transporter receptor subunit TctC
MRRAGISGHMLLAAVLSLAPPSLPAAAAYPERHIDLIVPYAAGGGFDLYARAVGKAMERHLGVSVVARNAPGAAGTRGIVAMFRAPADGYTFAIIDLPGGMQPQILGEPVQYDLDKVTWLGVVNIGTYSLVVGRSSPFQTLDKYLSGKPRVPFMATTGGNMLAAAKIAVTTLKAEARYLTGFQGGPDTHLAVMRGEADAAMGIDLTITRHIESGDLKRILWFQRSGARGGEPGVPTVDDIGHPELANLALYRLFAAPSGLPNDVRVKLRDAMQKALHDPELRKWSEATGSPLDPGTPEEAQRLYQEQKAFMLRNIEILRTK